MIRLARKQNDVTVFADNTAVGVMELYDNPFHGQNQYLFMKPMPLDAESIAELFEKLYAAIGKPLQIMTRSDNGQLIDFITSGGFQCRRKCYEVEATAEDFLGRNCHLELLLATRGEKDYAFCCRLLYARYAKTHEKINPLTADYETFVSRLPDRAYYCKDKKDVFQLAFVEGNEIAYVCGGDEDGFLPFAQTLICQLFSAYPTIFFEADDCDATAMALRALFCGQESASYDTFLYEGKPMSR